MTVGMQAAWVQRSSSTIFDPWGVEPTAVVASLSELDELLHMAATP